MAIGDTVQAGLMRIDPSAILRAGEAQARVGERIGQTVSGLATTYFDTKKRNKELEGERKGITDALRMVGKFRPDMSDDINAQIQFLEDADNPLSQRVAGGIRFLQNIDMAEKLRSTAQAEQLAADKFASDKRLADFKLAADQLGYSKDIFKLTEDIKKSKEADIVQPVLSADGQPIAGLARMGTTLLRQDPRTPGQFSILGTGVENIQQVRTDKAEDIIGLGRQRAEEFDITAKPIKPRIAAGGDVGGFFEDAMLYAGGLVGLLGKEMDEKIYDLGLGDREEQTARLTFVNAQIRPMLLRAVTSRGNVYSQKQIDTEILAGPKENNTAVQKKLREYPTLLENALTNAETVLRDPEIKPGTSVYEDARFIAMQIPTILRQIRSSMGMSGMGTVGTMGQSPNVDALLESLPRDTNRSRADLDVTDILSQ